MNTISPTERVYTHIKNDIKEKRIFPGSRIVEADICAAEDVSRAVVRMALAQLKNEGLVRIVPNKGAYVNKPTHEEIANMYNTRLWLELGAAQQALEHVSQPMLDAMEANFRAQEALLHNFSIVEYAVLNRDFHWEIVKAAQNAYYEKYLNEIYNVVHVYIVYYDTSKDNTDSLRSHRMILDALRERNGEKLAEAVRLDNTGGASDLRRSGLLCGSNTLL